MPFRREISDRTIEALKSVVLDAIVAVDADGLVVAWNQLAADMFGWSADESGGSAFMDLLGPGHHQDNPLDGMAFDARSDIEGLVGRRIERHAIDRKGREFPVELSVVPAPQGGDAAFVAFIRDITDRVAAQARLALNEASLRLATDAAEIGTWDLDVSADALTWSDRTKAMFGISPGVTCTMADFQNGLHPDDREATMLAFASALDPRTRATYDVQYRTVGKEDRRVRWVAAKGKGLFDARGRCVRAVGTAIDVTARKEAEIRASVMVELTDILHRGDTHEALASACALMGRHFAASRVGFGLLDPIKDTFSYGVCWTDGGVPPLLGDYPARAFGTKIVAKLSAGETVVVGDLQEDPVQRRAGNSADRVPRSTPARSWWCPSCATGDCAPSST